MSILGSMGMGDAYILKKHPILLLNSFKDFLKENKTRTSVKDTTTTTWRSVSNLLMQYNMEAGEKEYIEKDKRDKKWSPSVAMQSAAICKVFHLDINLTNPKQNCTDFFTSFQNQIKHHAVGRCYNTLNECLIISRYNEPVFTSIKVYTGNNKHLEVDLNISSDFFLSYTGEINNIINQI